MPSGWGHTTSSSLCIWPRLYLLAPRLGAVRLLEIGMLPLLGGTTEVTASCGGNSDSSTPAPLPHRMSCPPGSFPEQHCSLLCPCPPPTDETESGHRQQAGLDHAHQTRVPPTPSTAESASLTHTHRPCPGSSGFLPAWLGHGHIPSISFHQRRRGTRKADIWA